MSTLDIMWSELHGNIETINKSEYSRIGLCCDTISFYDLAICLGWDIPDEICRQIEIIEKETALFQLYLGEENDVEESRYFRFLACFDNYIFEDLMLLITHRIDVELYRSYTQHTNYKKYLDTDLRLQEIFAINSKIANDCRNSIYRNRGVRIGKNVYLPIQFKKVLRLIERAIESD